MVVGITNVLNNCFLNSIIQMLSISLDLIECFISDKVGDEKVRIYRDLFNLCVQNNKSISITNFILYYMRNLQKDYVVGRHQDASESLGYILDDVINKTPFQIKIKQIVYDKDDKQSETITSENYISVPLKESIQLSVDAFFETQNDISENIKKIEYKSDSLPDFLFINLKRFNPITYEKDNTEIEISNIIIFGGYKYVSIAYINHIGTSSMGGHYVCIKNVDDKWILFDDDKLTTINNFNDILKTQSCAYIFLYKKIDENEDIEFRKYTPKRITDMLESLKISEKFDDENEDLDEDYEII